MKNQLGRNGTYLWTSGFRATYICSKDSLGAFFRNFAMDFRRDLPCTEGLPMEFKYQK